MVLALGHTATHIFGIVFAVAVIGAQAWLAATIARRKDRPFWLYFVAGVIVPLFALLGALLLPRHRRLASKTKVAA
jgi:hypothetical protein